MMRRQSTDLSFVLLLFLCLVFLSGCQETNEKGSRLDNTPSPTSRIYQINREEMKKVTLTRGDDSVIASFSDPQDIQKVADYFDSAISADGEAYPADLTGKVTFVKKNGDTLTLILSGLGTIFDDQETNKTFIINAKQPTFKEWMKQLEQSKD